MPVVKITGQGLSAIALLVALLWGCLIAENRILREAVAGREQALDQLRRLRRRAAPQPLFVPSPYPTLPPRPAPG